MNEKPVIIGRLNEASPRAETWRRVFGSLEVPLISPVPKLVHVTKDDILQHVYLVDISKLSDEQKKQYIEQAALLMGAPQSEAEESLSDPWGIRIQVRDVTVIYNGKEVQQ